MSVGAISRGCCWPATVRARPWRSVRPRSPPTTRRSDAITPGPRAPPASPPMRSMRSAAPGKPRRCANGTDSFPRRNRDTGKYQPIADRVIKLEALAQQHDRQHRPKYRHEVDERRGAVGADELDAAIEEQIAEQRREDADKGEAEKALGIEHHRPPAGDFKRDERDEQHRAAAHADDEKRQRMDRRPLAQY